jgi:hypothetical protein
MQKYKIYLNKATNYVKEREFQQRDNEAKQRDGVTIRGEKKDLRYFFRGKGRRNEKK